MAVLGQKRHVGIQLFAVLKLFMEMFHDQKKNVFVTARREVSVRTYFWYNVPQLREQF